MTAIDGYDRQPDFVVIGAAKCATRWLCQCLNEHPDVFISTQEIHYFSRHYAGHDPLPSAYLKHFSEAGDAKAVGESSNTYLNSRVVPARLAASLPDAKLLLAVRNPVARAYSDYCMHLRLGLATRDITEHLDPDRALPNAPLETGLYYELLQRFLRYCPAERVHIVVQEQMWDRIKTQPEEALEPVWQFLDVEGQFRPVSLDKRFNTREARFVMPALRRRLRGSPLMQRTASVFRAGPLRHTVQAVFGRSIKYPPLPIEIEGKLREYYREDAQRLSELVNQDLVGQWFGDGQSSGRWN